MKNGKKVLARAAIALLALVMVFGAIRLIDFAPKAEAYSSFSKNWATEYYYPSGTAFVKNIAVCYYKNRDSAKNAITGIPCTLVDKDLTSGTGGTYYIYMGYNTTTDPTAANACKGIRVTHNNDGVSGHPTSCSQSGATWWKCNTGSNSTYAPKLHGDADVDLNKGAGGATLKLYATYDRGFGPAITSITANGTQRMNSTGWTDVQDFGGAYRDVNSDAGGDYIYLHYYTPCTAVNTNTLRSEYATGVSLYNNSSRYVSVSALASALNTAEAILNNVNDGYTTYTQTQINSAATAVTNAINALQTKVTFNGNSGTPSASSVNVTIGRNSTVSYNFSSYTASKTGYTFNGWATTTTGTPSKTTITVGFNNTLYARWTANTYTVAYNGNGSTSGSTANSSHTYDTAKNLTSNGYARTGYTFAGWATSSNGAVAYANGASVTNLTSTQGATVTLYAKWNPITYTVKYNANGGTGTTASSTHTYDVAKALTAIGFTRTGYTFQGWATSASGSVVYANIASVTNLSSTQGATINLYAKWAPITYTVYYKANGGTGTTDPSYHTYDVAKNLTANGFTKTGYNFAGWATSETGNAVYSNGQSVTNLTSSVNGILNFYAKWTPVQVNVTLNSNGATTQGSSSVTATYGYVLPSITIPSRVYTVTYNYNGSGAANTSANAAYAFGGYYTSGNTQKINATGAGVGECLYTTAQTLTAKWTAASVTLPTPTRTGHTFGGWYSDSACTSFIGNGGAAYTPTANTTLYAKWTLNTYTVRFFAEDGTQIGASQTINHGSNATPPAAQTKVYDNTNHYTFNGWSGYTNITANKDITATFTATAHTYSNAVTTQPTCTATGIRTYTCGCGRTYTETVAALGHDLVSHEAQAVTCLEIGWDAYNTCSRCDYTTYVEIPALGHYLVAHEAKAATCTAIGWNAYNTCSRCDYTTYVAIPALGHDLVFHEAQEETCTAIGWDAYNTCSRCDYTTYVAIPALGHDIVAHEAQEETCTEIGWDAYDTCSRCDYTTYVVIPALGHDKVTHEAQAVTCTEIGWDAYETCSRCDYTTYVEIEALGHDKVAHEAQEETCTEIGWDAYDTCSRCDYTTYVAIPALGHTADAAVKENEVLPTCLVNGSYDSVVYCSVCDEELSREEIIVVALGHDLASHDAQAVTCLAIGWDAYNTCSRCDYTTYVEIEALGHDKVAHEAKAVTCTEIGWDAYETCSRCDYTTYVEIEALGHDKVAHEAQEETCTEIGWDAYDTCSRCDYTTYVAIPALGHTADAAVKENEVLPTCLVNGSYDSVVYCSVCDEELSREEIIVAALGHDLVSHEAQAVTCLEIGWDAYDTCSRCDYTTYIAIPALGHDKVAHEAQAVTCTEIGWDAYDTCSRCDYTTYAEIPALGHDLVAHAAQEETCTEIGWDAYDTCSRCDYTTYVAIPALGHTADAAVKENEVLPTCLVNGSYDSVVYCSVCDEELSREEIIVAALGHDLVSHEAQAVTCLEIGWDAYDTCSRCDYTTYVEIPALGHTAAEAIKENEVLPTCLDEGSYDSVVYCSVCTEELSREEIIVAALGHDKVAHEAQEETCTAIGWDAYDTCLRCDYTTYTEIPALGHDLITHAAKAATCTEIGWDAYDTCSRCDYTTYVAIPALGHNLTHVPARAETCAIEGNIEYWCCAACSGFFEDENGETEIEAEEVVIAVHSHTPVYAEALDATCTQPGHTAALKCSECGIVLEAEAVIPALGHDLEAHQAKAATCTEIGWAAYDTCSRCDYTTYEEIPALGHTAAEAVKENEVLPTCIVNGSYDSVVYCSVCTAELSREEIVVDALGHDLIAHQAKAATCTAIGWAAYETCSRCDYTTYVAIPALGHTAAEAVKENEVLPTCLEAGSYDSVVYCSVCDAELSREEIIVDALGHDITTHDGQEATCIGIGWAAYDTCSRCDYTTYSEIAPLGHDYSAVVTAPTCTADGYTTHTCTRCDDAYTDSTVAALGHDWDDGSITTAATCNDEGVKTYTCSRCDEEKTEAVSATGHTVVTDEAVAPDCVNTGLTEGTHCSVCGTVIIAQESIPALGHDYSSVVTAPTCTEEGFTTYTCARCDDSYTTAQTAALGHDYVAHEAKAATCTEIGWDAYETCARCDYTTYTEIPAHGHDAVADPAMSASCTENGHTAGHICSDCGEILDGEEIIPATGHTDVDDDHICDECHNHTGVCICGSSTIHDQSDFGQYMTCIMTFIFNVIRKIFVPFAKKVAN